MTEIKVKAVVDDRRYASRKFMFATAIWLVGTLAWLSAWMEFWLFTTEQWISFSQWILGLYVAGNVSDTIATKSTEADNMRIG